MSFNLGHPDNAKANQLAQCQRVAALWVNQLTRGKITRAKVENSIGEYPEEEQKLIREWLNNYIAKSRPTSPKPTYRKVPEWVRKRL